MKKEDERIYNNCREQLVFWFDKIKQLEFNCSKTLITQPDDERCTDCIERGDNCNNMTNMLNARRMVRNTFYFKEPDIDMQPNQSFNENPDQQQDT